MNATLGALDSDWMVRFIRLAHRAKHLSLAADVSREELLEHFSLANDGRPTNAAVLLFGKDPKRFLFFPKSSVHISTE